MNKETLSLKSAVKTEEERGVTATFISLRLAGIADA
jgi:hypothetical protein